MREEETVMGLLRLIDRKLDRLLAERSPSSEKSGQSALCPAQVRPRNHLMFAHRGRIWVLGTLEHIQPGEASPEGWSWSSNAEDYRSELSELATCIGALAKRAKEE